MRPMRRGQLGLLAATAAVMVASAASAVESRPFSIASSAMAPTLDRGDVIFASPIETPERGDVIVFKAPDFAGGGDMTFVMRVVGVGGDQVQMKAGELWINGVALTRMDDGPGAPGMCWSGATVRRWRETNPIGRSYVVYDCGSNGDLDDTPAVLVPAGHYFVMGDHRDNAADSRISRGEGGIGLIPREKVVGRALLRSGGVGVPVE